MGLVQVTKRHGFLVSFVARNANIPTLVLPLELVV
jgi:hypothetical protein